MGKYEIIIYENGSIHESYYVEGERGEIEKKIYDFFISNPVGDPIFTYEIRPLSPLFSHVETRKSWKISKTTF